MDSVATRYITTICILTTTFSARTPPTNTMFPVTVSSRLLLLPGCAFTTTKVLVAHVKRLSRLFQIVFAAALAYGVAGDGLDFGRPMSLGHSAGVAAGPLSSARALAGAAEAAIQSARATEAAARGAHAHALHNAQAINAARIANIHRANAAAVENAHAAHAASSAAHASAGEMARAAEAERIANAARLQAIAIANARAIEVGRLASAARAQAAAVAVSAAQAQALADAMAHAAHVGAVREGSIVVGPVAVSHTPHGAGGLALGDYGHKIH
ncbi:hypothetical protein EVAR_13910_1 [Eumeta japonica]|uniref:Uncharacterized protein n=1 Tax=Eumeta variegata TaxID=151549 RepID=A0A4C1U954_EUMVA|nr:hypothetical protein EVAR_13910_1 [Eumeta japonica]